MTPEQLKAEIDKLRNHPLADAHGSYADMNRIIVALYDRLEVQRIVIDDLSKRVGAPFGGP